MDDIRIRMIVTGADEKELERVMGVMDHTINRLRYHLDRWVTVEVYVNNNTKWKRRHKW